MSKSGTNHGSIKKLNWKEPTFHEKVEKAVSHENRAEIIRRNGTPPTRRGAFNGSPTSLSPSLAFEDSPALIVNKAVLQPVKYSPGGDAQFQRKRDPSGKFAPAQDTGTQSTAEEDKQLQERGAKLREHKLNEELHGHKAPLEKEAKKAMPPGMSGADDSLTGINDSSSSKMVGSTSSGKPIFDDPYHSAHEDFTDMDHQDAANLHQQMADAAQDQMGTMQGTTAAQAHQQSAMDAKPPGSRFLENLFQQQQGPIVQDPMLDPTQDPSMAPFMDLLGSSQANPMIPHDPMEQGQQPMGQQSMIDQEPMMGQDTMAQDPMDAYLNQDSMAVSPMVDQNKPLPGMPEMEGPKPGMYDTRTGTGVGPQTEIGHAYENSPSNPDITDLFDSNEPDMGSAEGSEVEASPEFTEPSEVNAQGSQKASDLNTPESNAGYPGPTSASNEKKNEALQRAVKALSRYMKKDLLPGGLGDNKKKEDFDPKEMKEGTKDEGEEHTGNKKIAQEIAMDHLTKDPKYYSKMKD